MSRRTLTEEEARAAVYGGCILGGGGGGLLRDGEARVRELFEQFEAPTLISIDELSDSETVACVALVGAPSAVDASLTAAQMIEAVQLLRDNFDTPIAALMTNENGASTTVNGWLQAAALGLPVLDSPANGRAHPTGSMGSMGLHAEAGYRSIQGYSGGAGDQQLSGVVSGALGLASDVVRQVSVHAGGLVSVCRNPVSVGFVRQRAAIGGVSQAIELGRHFFAAAEGRARIDAVVDALGAEVLAEGAVTECQLSQEGGFDVGEVRLGNLELTFWNEYMTASADGERLATFPELIMTLDSETGRPVITAEIAVGQSVAVVRAPVQSLLLGSTMHDLDLLAGIEPIVKQDIVKYQEELWQ